MPCLLPQGSPHSPARGSEVTEVREAPTPAERPQLCPRPLALDTPTEQKGTVTSSAKTRVHGGCGHPERDNKKRSLK